MASDHSRQRRGSIAAAVVVGLIAIAAALLLVTHVISRSSGSDVSASPVRASSPPPPVSPSPSAPTPAAGSSSTCGLADGPQTIPSDAPKTAWELGSSGVALPTSNEFGPGITTDDLHSCFSHNPTGAVFALADYAVDANTPEVTNAQIRTRLIIAPNSAAFARDVDPVTVQIAGFNVIDYTAARATITLALKSTGGTSAGSLFGVTYALGWSHGDWRIVLPSSTFVPSALASLEGYVAWSGAA